MKSYRIGVLGCSGFARRAMIPALLDCKAARLECIASREPDKARAWADEFGCNFAGGYNELLRDPRIDAVYMPLPTGLHEEWVLTALSAGKHVLVEKSFATDLLSAERMVAVAKAKHLLIVENFQFQTHLQWKHIMGYMHSGELGDVHLIRSTFGFPPLPRDNFRWNKDLGGGARLDAGAYMAKVSRLLLGQGLEILGTSLQYDHDTGVDIYGEAMFRNPAGQVAQVAYGFDYFYQCRVELLGTKGKLSTNRVFTAPPDYEPVLLLEKQDTMEKVRLPADNHFRNMWTWFIDTLNQCEYRSHYDNLLDQARLLDGMDTARKARKSR